MKKLTLFVLIFFSASSFSQKTDKEKWVKFKTLFKLSNATKDGFYCNGYVVNIDYEEGKKYNGKTVLISGRMKLIKGLGKHNFTGTGKTKLYVDGRIDDYYFINKPIIILIKKQ